MSHKITFVSFVGHPSWLKIIFGVCAKVSCFILFASGGVKDYIKIVMFQTPGAPMIMEQSKATLGNTLNIYIYIYQCGPVHTMHGKVRLCVERCRHSWSCSVKRLWSSGAERARAPMSSASADPSGLEVGSVVRANHPSRPSSCSHFERPS